MEGQVKEEQANIALLKVEAASKEREHSAIVKEARADVKAKACMWFMSQTMGVRSCGSAGSSSAGSTRSESPASMTPNMFGVHGAGSFLSEEV